MKLILLLAALAQASDDFVTFDVCMLSTTGRWTFVKHPTMAPAEVRPSIVGAVTDAEIRATRKVGGLKCSLIAGPTGTLFVVGSPEEVKAKLEGKK